MSFKNLVGNQRVYFRQYAGLKFDSKTGKTSPEYKEASGKVNPLLVFNTHVVVNIGGKHGTPQVVDDKNFIRAGSVPKNAKTYHSFI